MKRPETLAWEKVRDFYNGLKDQVPISRTVLAKVLDVHPNTIGLDEQVALWVDDYEARERGKKLWEYEVWVLLFVRFCTIYIGRPQTTQLLAAFGNDKLSEQQFIYFQEKLSNETSRSSQNARINRAIANRANRKVRCPIAS